MNRRIDVVYVDEKGGASYIGYAESPEKMNDLLLGKFPDIALAIEKGMFYFKFENSPTKIPFTSFPYALGAFVNILYNGPTPSQT
jgi:hypothetical protein